MSTFCLLAYIPCIILIIWLLVELRKYLSVTKRLKYTENIYEKMVEQRLKQKSRKRFIETIPPPPPPEYLQERSIESYPPLNEPYEYSSFRGRPHRRTARSRDHAARGRTYRLQKPSLSRSSPTRKHYNDNNLSRRTRTKEKGLRKRRKTDLEEEIAEEDSTYEQEIDNVEWD